MHLPSNARSLQTTFTPDEHLLGGDQAQIARHAGLRMPDGAGSTTTFEVLVRGELSDDLIADIGARQFRPRRGKTVIVVDVIDQSHLHGVLGWLEDRNIEIERFNPV